MKNKKDKDYPFIVFSEEHYNPLGIIRSLGENGINPIVIVVKSKIKITSKSKYVKTLHIVDTLEDGYNLLLEKYSGLTNKPFVFTSDDIITKYLDERYEKIVDKFYFYNAGKAGNIEYYMNKYNICKLAEQCGIPLAKTQVVEKGVIPDNLQFPIITKAIASTISDWKADSFICNNSDELIEAYKTIRSEKVLLQEYINKKNELCLDGFSYNKGNDVVVTIASTYDYILPDTYSPLMTVDNFKDNELLDKIKKMFSIIGFEGIFSMEFLIGPNDELYFLEINFRNSTWSYASTWSGNPLPVLWYKSMLGEDISLVEINKPFRAVVEFDDFRNRVKSGNMKMKEWLKDIFDCEVRYYFSRRDIRPFLSYILGCVKRRIFK